MNSLLEPVKQSARQQERTQYENHVSKSAGIPEYEGWAKALRRIDDLLQALPARGGVGDGRLTRDRCDHCGAKVSSYPNGCPGCGAPQCCQSCCDKQNAIAGRLCLTATPAACELTRAGPALPLVAHAVFVLSALFDEQARQFLGGLTKT